MPPTGHQRARLVKKASRLTGQRVSFLESFGGVAGDRGDMKFKGPSKDRAGLLSYQHLEVFLGVIRCEECLFVFWGDPSRVG